MSTPSGEVQTRTPFEPKIQHAKTPLEQKTLFHIRMYEALFISASFCFVYSLYHTGVVLWILFFGTVYVAFRNLIATNTENLPVNQRAVLITGCDSGIGFDLAKYLLGQNFQVFAGCLDPESDGAMELQNMNCSHLFILKLNVTDDESVKQCVNIVREICFEKGLWALVNNAGIDKFGSVEFSTMDMYQKVMDVNYFGTVRVTKAFMPFIRKSKGRILNVTSCNGRFAAPNRAAYCPSKFAVEAFSDTLRIEVQPFGVRVCVIEPGHYGGASKILNAQKTFLEASLDQMWESASEDVRSTYGKDYLYHLQKFVQDGMQSSHPNTRPIIEGMYHAILNPAPKFRYVIGGGQFFIDVTTILVHGSRILPVAVMDFIVRHLHLSNWPVPLSLQE